MISSSHTCNAQIYRQVIAQYEKITKEEATKNKSSYNQNLKSESLNVFKVVALVSVHWVNIVPCMWLGVSTFSELGRQSWLDVVGGGGHCLADL